MPKINSNSSNPYGLSVKQRLTVKDIVERIKGGLGVSVVESVGKFYRVKNRNVAYQIAHQNLSKTNFREALYRELEAKGVMIGDDCSVMGCLFSGLNAVKVLENGEKIPDYMVRLEYVKVINNLFCKK